MADAPDFQNNNLVAILNYKGERHGIFTPINHSNLLQASIYLAVRHSVQADWLNDRDQFLYPNNKWENDLEFQTDCLATALFHGQNRIRNTVFMNHWIPFTEYEVDAREKFDSNFMVKFIQGKIKPDEKLDIFSIMEPKAHYETKLYFSETANEVFNAGRELWRYYHKQKNINVNASLYDIREYFQGRNEKGNMNPNSDDETYNNLIGALRDKLKILAKKIEPKVYEYGFLKN